MPDPIPSQTKKKRTRERIDDEIARKVIKWMNSSSNFDSNRFIHRLYIHIELILSPYMCLDCDRDERKDSRARLHHLI